MQSVWRCGIAALALLLPATGLAQPAVEWRVKDRFRLFDHASVEAKARIHILLESLRATPDKPLKDFYGDFLAALSGLDGSRSHSASLRTSNYIPANEGTGRRSGRYAADYLFPEHYSIELKVAGAPAGADCTYAAGLETRTGACGEWTSLAVMDGRAASRAGWEIKATVQTSVAGAAPIPQEIGFTDEFVVALGDSYISGEGNPDVPSVITDQRDGMFKRPSWGSKVKSGPQVLREAEWWDEPCHRSLLSWPVISTIAYAARDPHKAVSFVHLGCSGAIAKDIYLHGETDLPGGGDERESQLALLDALRQRPTADWKERAVSRMFLSVGGNDIGFVGVLTTLMLPPNGFLLDPWATRIIGKNAKAVCPYIDTGKPLSRLCDGERSAQIRLDELPKEYIKLAEKLEMAGIKTNKVYQPIYPNPLIAEGGVPCDTNPDNDKDKDKHLAARKGGSEAHSGFEAIMGKFPRIARGLRKSWGFELRYDREEHTNGVFDNESGLLDKQRTSIECDWAPERGDSEVCQGLWVHARLNQVVGNTSWVKITDHYDVIAGHGICRRQDDFPRRLPLIKKQWWIQGHTPQTINPYAQGNPRWFRTPNDSIVTQFGFYGDEPRFHHGTVHPTFNAHVAIAQAAYEKAFPKPGPTALSAP